MADSNGTTGDEYSAESMGYLSNRERGIFFTLFLLIYLAAVIGNVSAICTTCSRKHRYIQKALIISLAVSDLIMATAYAVHYLNTFAHSLLKWTMGEILCYAITFWQIFGLTAGAEAVIIIAIDRYRSAVHVTMKRWNPNLWPCLLGILLMWGIATGIAYPTTILYQYKRITIVMESQDGDISKEHNYVCFYSSRAYLLIYYMSITLIIFLPLLIIVSWLYYNIYKLVYKRNADRKISDSHLCSDKDNIDTSANINKRCRPPQRRNINFERKIRTFKIMIFLILVFFLLRSPHWMYRSIIYSYEYMDREDWLLNFALSSVALLSCAINPFLYSFLPETMTRMEKVGKAIKDFTCEVCCCCCSNAEFEQFEKENPFSLENYDREYNQRTNNKPNKNLKVSFEEVITSQHGKIERF